MKPYDIELNMLLMELTGNQLRSIPHIDNFIDSYGLDPDDNNYYILNYKKALILENNHFIEKAWNIYRDMLKYEDKVSLSVFINVLLGAIRCAKDLHKEKEAVELQEKLIALHY